MKMLLKQMSFFKIDSYQTKEKIYFSKSLAHKAHSSAARKEQFVPND